MARQGSTARKGGARTKMTTGALDKVLFVRANQDLLDRLEKLRLRKSEAAKVTLSTADVARAILLDALDDEDLEKK